MEIPTRNLQMKIAEVMHDQAGCGPAPFAECSHRDLYVLRSAYMLGMIMPVLSREVFPVIRDDMRTRINQRIIAELVCCSLYDSLNNARPEQLGMTEQQFMETHPRHMAKLLGLDYHAICHWGGYAAAIALGGEDRDV